MARYMVETLECPICGHTIPLSTETVQVTCSQCHNSIDLRGHFCPQCGAYHSKVVQACRVCKLGMVRRCPQCDAQNWTGDAHCWRCQAPLDMITFLTRQVNTADRLYQQMSAARDVKNRETEAASARLERMLEEERAQNLELLRRRQAQAEREQKMYRTAAVVLGVFLLLIAIYLLVTWL